MAAQAAVVIGINYTGGPPSVSATAATPPRNEPMPGAEADAQTVAARLQGAGYATRTLLGAAATRQTILDALEEAQGEAGPDGLLVCYFAGHGAVDPYNRQAAYLVPADGDPDSLYLTGIALDDLARRYLGDGPALALFDCCLPGANPTAAPALVAPDQAFEQAAHTAFAHEPGHGVLAACADSPATRETPGGLGVFTQAILDYWQANANVDTAGLAGAVTAALERAGRHGPAYGGAGPEPLVLRGREGSAPQSTPVTSDPGVVPVPTLSGETLPPSLSPPDAPPAEVLPPYPLPISPDQQAAITGLPASPRPQMAPWQPATRQPAAQQPAARLPPPPPPPLAPVATVPPAPSPALNWRMLGGIGAILIVLLVCGTLVFSAGGSTPAPTATPVPTATAVVIPTPQPGEARFLLSSEPSNTDPQKISSVNETAWASLVFEPLMELNEKGEVVPAAAERLDVAPSGLVYTATLPDGLKYSDGTPLTAHNFEYAFRRLLDPTIPGRDYAAIAYDIVGAEELSTFTTVTDTARLGQLQNALGVHAPDDRTIVFTLKAPVAYFPYILALWVGYPVREDMIAKGGGLWTEPATYVGNGPLILRDWEHGSRAVWEANPNYRKGALKIKRLEALTSVPQDALTAYKAGQLDWLKLTPAQVQTVQDSSTLKEDYVRVPGACTDYLGFNVQRPPFDDVKVRQAVVRALDREYYVNTVMQGAGQSALSFIPPDRPGYAPDVKQATFDDAAAKQLLADAGFPNGQGLAPIKLTYSTSSSNEPAMTWVHDQLQANLGIDAPLEPVEASAYNALLQEQATVPQILNGGWCQDYPDPQDWLSLVFRDGVSITHLGWRNERFDTLTRQADAERDPTHRLDLYKQAQQILIDEAPAVFLDWTVNDFLIKHRLGGVRDHLASDDTLIPGVRNLINISAGAP